MKKILLFSILVVMFSVNYLNAGYKQTSGTIGTSVLTEPDGSHKMYNKVCIQPEFEFGKIGIGLDLALYFDEDGNLREQDWNSWDNAIEKIWYLRYAKKGDPVFIQAGALPGMTLGHGIIFNRYDNTLLYPDVKKKGLEVDIDFGTFGIETLTSNLIEAEVVGARAYYRPFYNSDMLLMNKLAFGLSAGLDVDPSSLYDKDQVSVIAVDAELPLIETGVFSSLLFADVAQMQLDSKYTSAHTYLVENTTNTSTGSKNNGLGRSVGFLGKAAVFDYRAEYRMLDKNFIYGYFNSFYEMERAYKAHEISGESGPMSEGPYFELGYKLMNKISILASYENYNHDPFSIYPWVHAELSLEPALLMNRFFVKMTYDKRNADTWNELVKIKGKDSILTQEIGYAIGGGNIMLVVVNEKTFDANGESFTRTSIETRMIF